jgi:hypothetical protein
MQYKRIYKCLRNAATGKPAISVTDENGYPVNTSFFDSFDETVAYFYELKDELARNQQMEIVNYDDFHFECRAVEGVSARNDSN